MKTLLTLIFCLVLGVMAQSCTKDEVLHPEENKSHYEAPKDAGFKTDSTKTNNGEAS